MTDEDLSNIFNAESENYLPEQEVPNDIDYDYGQKVMAEIESEYRGLGSIKAEREKDRAKLNEKIRRLQHKLRTLKNVRNHRLININKDMASKRKAIKAEIERLKDLLYNIDEEENGASVTSEKLVESTLFSK